MVKNGCPSSFANFVDRDDVRVIETRDCFRLRCENARYRPRAQRKTSASSSKPPCASSFAAPLHRRRPSRPKPARVLIDSRRNEHGSVKGAKEAKSGGDATSDFGTSRMQAIKLSGANERLLQCARNTRFGSGQITAPQTGQDQSLLSHAWLTVEMSRFRASSLLRARSAIARLLAEEA